MVDSNYGNYFGACWTSVPGGRAGYVTTLITLQQRGVQSCVRVLGAVQRGGAAAHVAQQDRPAAGVKHKVGQI